RPAAPGEAPITTAMFDQVNTILPGFEGVTPLAIPDTSPIVGKTLAQIDLRARTGATVLAIRRGDSGVASPSPTDPLRAGDVLALAGSEAAIAAARDLLAPTTVPTSDPALGG
nr:TrkA C-terminal domain-containing protein [Deltaproteobacteria bacterium]